MKNTKILSFTLGLALTLTLCPRLWSMDKTTVSESVPRVVISSNDGFTYTVNKAIIFDTFRKSSPLSPVVRNCLSQEGTIEAVKGKMRCDTDKEALGLMLEIFTALHNEKNAGLDVEDKTTYQQLINKMQKRFFDERYKIKDRIFISLELCRFADFLCSEVLYDICAPVAYRTLCGKKILSDFIAHPNTYRRFFSELPMSLPLPTASGNYTAMQTIEQLEDLDRCAMAPNGKYMISGYDSGSLLLWEKNRDGMFTAVLPAIEGHEPNITSLVAAADSTHFISGAYDEKIKIWEIDPKTNRLQLKESLQEPASINSVAIASDGTFIASGLTNHAIHIRPQNADGHFNDGDYLLNGHDLQVKAIAISPNNLLLASGDLRGTICLWSRKDTTATFNPLPQKIHGHRKEAHTGIIEAIAFSPLGELFATSSWDKKIKLWSIYADGSIASCPQTLEGHTAGIISIAFDPEGSMLVSGAHDKCIILWQKNAKGSFEQSTQIIDAHAFPIHSLALSTDKRLMSCSSNIILHKPEIITVQAPVLQAMLVHTRHMDPEKLIDLRPDTPAAKSLEEIATAGLQTELSPVIIDRARTPMLTVAAVHTAYGESSHRRRQEETTTNTFESTQAIAPLETPLPFSARRPNTTAFIISSAACFAASAFLFPR